MNYQFHCRQCRTDHERQLKIADRNKPQTCPKGHVLTRTMTQPQAVLWAGKFQGRWNKVAEGDW